MPRPPRLTLWDTGARKTTPGDALRPPPRRPHPPSPRENRVDPGGGEPHYPVLTGRRRLRRAQAPGKLSDDTPAGHTRLMAAECTFQFSCPSCSALLQAVLKQALTSVQCGECFDVFDVQMPTAYAAPSARIFRTLKLRTSGGGYEARRVGRSGRRVDLAASACARALPLTRYRGPPPSPLASSPPPAH